MVRNVHSVYLHIILVQKLKKVFLDVCISPIGAIASEMVFDQRATLSIFLMIYCKYFNRLGGQELMFSSPKHGPPGWKIEKAAETAETAETAEK